MNWQSIETAPKDCYCLGHDPVLTRPFVMKWNARKGKFEAVGGFGDETPIAWMSLPALEHWTSLDTAPKDKYCLGYDIKRQRPFVMLWNVCDSAFEAFGGGDESPTYWLELPLSPAPSSFQELAIS